MINFSKSVRVAFALAAPVLTQACAAIDTKMQEAVNSMAPALPTMEQRINDYDGAVELCEERNHTLNSVPFNSSLVILGGAGGLLAAKFACFGIPPCAVGLAGKFVYEMDGYLEEAMIDNCPEAMKPDYIKGDLQSGTTLNFSKAP